MFFRLSVLPGWRERLQTTVFFRVVWEVEMSRDWFESVFIVNFDISRMFLEAARSQVMQ